MPRNRCRDLGGLAVRLDKCGIWLDRLRWIAASPWHPGQQQLEIRLERLGVLPG
jgi:hypothetical protein